MFFPKFSHELPQFLETTRDYLNNDKSYAYLCAVSNLTLHDRQMSKI